MTSRYTQKDLGPVIVQVFSSTPFRVSLTVPVEGLTKNMLGKLYHVNFLDERDGWTPLQDQRPETVALAKKRGARLDNPVLIGELNEHIHFSLAHAQITYIKDFLRVTLTPTKAIPKHYLYLTYKSVVLNSEIWALRNNPEFCEFHIERQAACVFTKKIPLGEAATAFGTWWNQRK